MDEDVAYLVGLILVRGTLEEQEDIKRLNIEFPYKSLEATGIKTAVKQRDALLLSANSIRDRVNELLDVDFKVEDLNNSVILSAVLTKNTMAWRNLKLILGGKVSYTEFQLNSIFYDVETNIRKELVRGVADATGFIRPSNHFYNRHRIYFEINNANWYLPLQLCKLLQGMGVGVQLIQWRHPNLRGSEQVNVNPENSTWAKEHQIKIFPEEFEKVGFYSPHKQKILEEFIEYNKKTFQRRHEECNPFEKGIRKSKPSHPCEEHNKIPEQIRGKHFDGYWQICQALGCTQGKPSPQITFDFEDVSEEDV
ncbi:MAG: hypothetical protein ACK4WF_02415 [Candidatus Brocadiales bacterium]